MKKIILGFLLSILTILSYSQSFDGVKIEGNRYKVVHRFINKGYTLKKHMDNVSILTGRVMGYPVELYIFSTPITKTTWKIDVYLPKQTNWFDIKNSYNELFTTFVDKYGEPSSSYNFFEDPYYEGDGYEISAVMLDKCHFSAYWNQLPASNLAVSIVKFMQVCITYENKANLVIYEEEKNINSKKVF
jgi:hypothetical protein